jgi:cytochrome bd-type quinol oxidase subunit 2
MDSLALLLSRLQFAFTVSFHIIFPSFSIGLIAWLTVLEALHLATRRPAYRLIFEFWLKIFGVAFGLGVFSGIVMAFQFGTNWSGLSRMSGPIQGPLLVYETFSAFALEASFFGILLFGRSRVPLWFYLFSKCDGEVRASANRLIPYLSLALLVFLVVVFVYALAENLQVMGRWLERPYLFAFPIIAAAAAGALTASVRHRRDGPPFYMGSLVFAAAFGTLAASFWPYMIPFSITIDEAAAPHSSLAFMFWGAGLVGYRVFRGKTEPIPHHPYQ